MGVTPLAGPGQRPGVVWGEAPEKDPKNDTFQKGCGLSKNGLGLLILKNLAYSIGQEFILR